MQVPCDEGVGAAKLAALNVAYKEREKRGVIKLNLVSLALTGGAILGSTCGAWRDCGAVRAASVPMMSTARCR